MKTSFITLSDLYLTVPFEEKEDAKEKGAKWDREQKLWHVPPGLDPIEFRNWWSFLGPAFKDRERLKKMGARYHRGLKSWYVPRDSNSKLDYDDFKEWWPDDCKAYLFNARFAAYNTHARGGQSTVFLGYDLTDDSKCAIKLFDFDGEDSDEVTEAFKREQDALLRLEGHPNILPLIDWGFHEQTGRYFTVTPWLQWTVGDVLTEDDHETFARSMYQRFRENLDPEVSENKFTKDILDELKNDDEDLWLSEFYDDNSGFLYCILSGLLHAANHSIIHRDIKPSNIFFDFDIQPGVLDSYDEKIGKSDLEKLLLECGKREGYVTYDDVNEVVAEDASSEEIEDILETISELGIKVTEDIVYKTVIGDFGSAKNWEQESNNQRTVFELRSAPWTPPREGNERYFESTFDGYAWGVLAVAAITKTNPKTREEIDDLLDGPFKKIVGGDIHEFISRVLNQDPTKRPQNISALAEEIELLNAKRREALEA
ncbi:MAG: hypothetical protein HOI21_09475 [Bacteroidetes Order II. Incertae sedis bacterium]|nr:hypothetical protein [Bacteroidetes Order II. bacterium]